MNTSLSSVNHHTSVNLLVPGTIGVMGVNYGPARHHDKSIQPSVRSPVEQTAVEGTTVVPSSPEPMTESPPLLKHDHPAHNQSPLTPNEDRELTTSPLRKDYEKTKYNGSINIANFMNNNRSESVIPQPVSVTSRDSISPVSHPSFTFKSESLYQNSASKVTTTTSPPSQHPILPLPLRAIAFSHSTSIPTNTHFPASPMTLTNSSPTASDFHDLPNQTMISSSSPFQPTTQLTSTSPQLVPLQTWHPHVYGPPVKSPTSHSIADILGFKRPRKDIAVDKMINSDEPLNLTTRHSGELRESFTKGKSFSK